MIYAVNKRTKEHRRYSEAQEWADAECRLVEADPDGWIEWHGESDCSPVPGKTLCKIRLSDGCELETLAPEEWSWSRGGDQWITAYRPILDANTKPEPPAWDGEGERPPVGARCMRGYERVLILAYTDVGSPVGPAVVYQSLDDPGDIDWAVSSVFSPIRNAEDRAVEEMVATMEHAIESQPSFVAVSSQLEKGARALYRAGYRKVGA